MFQQMPALHDRLLLRRNEGQAVGVSQLFSSPLIAGLRRPLVKKIVIVTNRFPAGHLLDHGGHPRDPARHCRLLSLAKQQQAEGFVEGLVPVGEERAEERLLSGGQDSALGRGLRERQPHERGQIAVVDERVRRSGQA